MTAFTGSLPVRPSGFDAFLIALGRWLVRSGERLAAEHHLAALHYDSHEERLRDGTAVRHSGLWV